MASPAELLEILSGADKSWCGEFSSLKDSHRTTHSGIIKFILVYIQGRIQRSWKDFKTCYTRKETAKLDRF